MTLGLIGFGKVAKKVCRIARAMEMNVLVHTRTRTEGDETEHGMKYAESLDHLLAEAHVVSLHVPLTKETEDGLFRIFEEDEA